MYIWRNMSRFISKSHRRASSKHNSHNRRAKLLEHMSTKYKICGPCARARDCAGSRYKASRCCCLKREKFCSLATNLFANASRVFDMFVYAPCRDTRVRKCRRGAPGLASFTRGAGPNDTSTCHNASILHRRNRTMLQRQKTAVS